MPDERRGADEVLVRVARLSAVANGVAAGLVAGVGLFVATNWLVIKGGPHVGQHLQLLAQYFPGYRVTFAGSLIGFFWAFLAAFVAAASVSALYNWCTGLRSRSAPPDSLAGG